MNDDTLPPNVADIRQSSRDRARAWRKAAYQKAKAAQKERKAAAALTPAGQERKAAQLAYRRELAARLKQQRKDTKHLRPSPAPEAEPEAAAQAEREAELRRLLSTGDQLSKLAARAEEAAAEGVKTPSNQPRASGGRGPRRLHLVEPLPADAGD